MLEELPVTKKMQNARDKKLVTKDDIIDYVIRGNTIRRYIHPNINAKVMHIRDIVEGQVVYAYWSKRWHEWCYGIEPPSLFYAWGKGGDLFYVGKTNNTLPKIKDD